jgi:hypothetical protein
MIITKKYVTKRHNLIEEDIVSHSDGTNIGMNDDGSMIIYTNDNTDNIHQVTLTPSELLDMCSFMLNNIKRSDK